MSTSRRKSERKVVPTQRYQNEETNYDNDPFEDNNEKVDYNSLPDLRTNSRRIESRTTATTITLKVPSPPRERNNIADHQRRAQEEAAAALVNHEDDNTYNYDEEPIASTSMSTSSSTTSNSKRGKKVVAPKKKRVAPPKILDSPTSPNTIPLPLLPTEVVYESEHLNMERIPHDSVPLLPEMITTETLGTTILDEGSSEGIKVPSVLLNTKGKGKASKVTKGGSTKSEVVPITKEKVSKTTPSSSSTSTSTSTVGKGVNSNLKRDLTTSTSTSKNPSTNSPLAPARKKPKIEEKFNTPTAQRNSTISTPTSTSVGELSALKKPSLQSSTSNSTSTPTALTNSTTTTTINSSRSALSGISFKKESKKEAVLDANAEIRNKLMFPNKKPLTKPLPAVVRKPKPIEPVFDPEQLAAELAAERLVERKAIEEAGRKAFDLSEQDFLMGKFERELRTKIRHDNEMRMRNDPGRVVPPRFTTFGSVFILDQKQEWLDEDE